MERLHGGERAAEELRRDAVVDHLEEADRAGGAADLIDDGGAGGVNGGEVDGGDVAFGFGYGSGFEVGEGFGWVDEEGREGLDAGVDEAFDSELGVVELFECFGTVVGRR